MDSFLDSKSSTRRPRSLFETFVTLACACLGVLSVAWIYSVWMTSGLSPPSGVDRAIVALSGPSNVTGTVYFSQTLGRGPVTVRGEIKGLDPNALRGFHVHQSGDLSNGCVAANAHFNPYNKPHGASTDKDRHVGDLGNIRSNADGIASFTFNDAQISLNGPLSIIGRAVVVHAGTDDLGKGGNEESLKTGNAGARAACGVIGIKS